MSEFIFSSDEYLKRIGLTTEITSSQECLKALHQAQHRTIPFENFDIALNRGIDLEPAKLFDKMVRTNRGGYCFELNGLLLMALQHFGFNARPLLGRVLLTGTPTGRGHQISLVTIEEQQWIVDVGFGGDTPKCPIPLVLGKEIASTDQTFRLVESELYGIILQAKKIDQWLDLYSFDLEHVCPADISYGNHFTSTHPDCFFVYSRVAALPIENGMVTLFNHSLKTVVDGKEKQLELPEGKPYLEALKSNFGIDLGVPYESLRPLPNNEIC